MRPDDMVIFLKCESAAEEDQTLPVVLPLSWFTICVRFWSAPFLKF